MLEEPVYLHLECDSYAPELMEFSNSKTFKCWRVIPPGETRYFFTSKGISHLSKSQPRVKVKINLPNLVVDDTKISISLNEANIAKTNFNNSVINDHYQYMMGHCLPRTESGKFIREVPKRLRTPWSIPISLFKDYKFDSDEILKSCFEFDWAMIPKFKMSNEDYLSCKEKFYSIYKLIHENYKIYSAIGRTESIFGIPWLMFNDLAYYKLKIIDGNKLTLTSADLMFKAIKGKKLVGKNSKLILVRFEFLEALFRLGIARYYDSIIVISRGSQDKARVNSDAN